MGVRVGSLSFADDVVLVGVIADWGPSFAPSGRLLLGMRINAAKSVLLLLVPAGEEESVFVRTPTSGWMVYALSLWGWVTPFPTLESAWTVRALSSRGGRWTHYWRG